VKSNLSLLRVIGLNRKCRSFLNFFVSVLFCNRTNYDPNNLVKHNYCNYITRKKKVVLVPNKISK